MDKNNLIFSKQIADEAIELLVKHYSSCIQIHLKDYPSRNMNGVFISYYKTLNKTPKIIVWTPNSQHRLLILIHELAHYHHWLRSDSVEYAHKFSRTKKEFYTYFIGWCIIRKYKLDTFITKKIWKYHTFGKLWGDEYGYARATYKEVEKYASGRDEVNLYI